MELFLQVLLLTVMLVILLNPAAPDASVSLLCAYVFGLNTGAMAISVESAKYNV